ncbi:PLP-dependent aminotransferase family protein [Ramlibacter sp. 2FC]|uniref:aminotransferase-like domain-containing protein n=1 Tax=Ramlibacter sp. 2FC TaxID=2502188 RepID=UPI001484E162|nr:PLP-dependent aminotransferase family protein [Ramlibacter sp. 2FC]
MITINSKLPTPLVRQVYDALVDKINKGALRAGTKLESVRSLARHCGISTMTVTNAYNRLVAEGYIEARPASGYFVTAAISRTTVQRRKPFVGNTSVDSLWLLQRVYEDDATLLNAGCGWLPPDHLYIDGLRHALAGLARKQAASFASYGTPYGYLPLRQQVQTQLAARSIDAAPHQIVLTHGASQALDLVARCLLQSRDTVLVDDPGYCNLFPTLRALDVRLIGVERTPEGPDVEALQALAQRYRPKAFFTNTNLHNPTGGCCTPAASHQILRLAEQYDFRIVEDDIFAGLQPAAAHSIASLDQLQRVVHIGSFSKTISPTLRVGFVACNEDMAERLVYLKMASGLTTSELSEKLVHAVLVEGHHRAHLARLAENLAVEQRAVCDGLAAAGMRLFTRPTGGLFVWAGFAPDMVDVREVAQRAVAEGIMLAPGYLFRPDQQPSPWLRFNVGYSNDPRLYRFLAAQVRAFGAGPAKSPQASTRD